MIWDLNNLQYIGTLPGHRGFVKCLHASYAKKAAAMHHIGFGIDGSRSE